ncbi:MAG: O-antigen ligase domain-containing protein, partial [Planctomycetota bacterium]
LLAGTMMDGREYRLRGAALAVGLVALGLTGSLGGWVALSCGAATMGALALTRTKGRSIAVGVGCGVAVLAVVLLASGVTAKRSHSMHVRSVYWKATGPIIASAPMLGVGLDNWQEHYYRTKSDVQQETTKAHNDYLQILSETGILGFLGFAGLLAFGLRKALVRASAKTPDPEPASPWLVAGVVSVVTLLGLLLAGDAVGRAISIVLAILWLAFWFLLKRMTKPSEPDWTRIGAAGGFVALLVHMMVDFQIYQFGTAACLVAVIALIAMLRGDATEVRLPKGVCLAATAILMAVSVPLLTIVNPRALAADNEIFDSKEALLAHDRGTSSNPTLLLSEALQVAEAAQKHNPFNPEAYKLFSQAKERERDLLVAVGARDSKDVEIAEDVVLQALQNAIALRPNSSPLHYEKSLAHRKFRRASLKSTKDPGLARAKAAEHLRLAVEHQRRAYELYPTFARNAYLLARLLEMSKDPDAPRYYKEALRLHDLAGRELENLDRMKLDALARARCLRSLGKAFEAHDLLDKHLRNAIQGLPVPQARRGLERFVKMSEDEMDDAMTPVLKDIVDAIIRDLK